MINKTNLLISDDFIHPEIKAIYGGKESAIEGYSRGEFALFLKEGRTLPSFYGAWRYAGIENPKFFFLNKAITNSRIERVLHITEEQNLLFEKALNEFYSDGVNFVNHLGNKQRLLDGRSPFLQWPDEVFKVVAINDELHKVKFNILDYYPI